MLRLFVSSAQGSLLPTLHVVFPCWRLTVWHECSNLLLERLMTSSDVFTVHVDTKSGLLGWWDASKQCAVSPIDRTSEHMVKIKMPYACKLLFQELQAMNIVPRISLQEL